MQIGGVEAARAKEALTRRLPLGECIVTCNSEHAAKSLGHFAKVSSWKEDKFFTGWTRREAVASAVLYARSVLKVIPKIILPKEISYNKPPRTRGQCAIHDGAVGFVPTSGKFAVKVV